MTASIDCPVCGHTANFNTGALDVAKIITVTDSDGKKWTVYLVTCEQCLQEFQAGGKDGRGNV